ncbi:MAG: TlpA family protein disulfide reductase [Aestuariibaculum sp.]
MKKTLLTLLAAAAIVACKEEPKDYVTFSGKITDKNSDSLVVRSRTFSKTIKVNENGTFKDTLKVETGTYNLYDGKESTSIFLKNGFDINLTLDTKAFDETVKFTGNGSASSNFLAKNMLLQEELLNIETLSELDKEGLEKEMESISSKLSEFYNSNAEVDTTITTNLKKNLEPMLKFYKQYVGDAIALKSDFPKGSVSPTFDNYENYKGGTTSLADLKGKYVYVDVWATWCGPCKVEIPSLKALEKEYHGKNIEFVSISVDEGRGYKADTPELAFAAAKEGWKKMIAEKEMGGIQLLAPEGWTSKFVTDYKIMGIPRFILIDPDGNIVSPDAPRPSSESIKELLKSLNI